MINKHGENNDCKYRITTLPSCFETTPPLVLSEDSACLPILAFASDHMSKENEKSNQFMTYK